MGTRALAMNNPDVVPDRQLLMEMYESHNLGIYRYAYRMLGDKDLAEDCVGDTFLRLLIAVRKGTLPENIRAFLYRIAHNWIADHYRRQPPLQVALDENLHSDPNSKVPYLLESEAGRQRVRSALLRLSVEQRQVIELRFLENWSHTKVAKALGRSVEATRAVQYRAVKALRQILSE